MSRTAAGTTIAAIATAAGRGAIGVVRVSGPAARGIAGTLLGRVPLPRVATWCDFRDAQSQLIDRGLALFFSAPASYTGEDVLELQAHGGVGVLRALLEATFAAGATPAQPGEFTERAFLNGKIDLLQAEAVGALIDAASAQSVRAAARACAGDFSQAVNAISTIIRQARVQLEAGIDFGDDVDASTASSTRELMCALSRLQDLLRDATAGARLAEGLDVAIIGAPNSGKSTLLNQLCGEDLAIVTPIPGTTRDVLSVDIQIEGLSFRLHDTAGLRDAEDPVEREGVRRARARLDTADLLLHVVAVDQPQTPELIHVQEAIAGGARCLTVRNKIDLVGSAPASRGTQHGAEVSLSALSGDGLALLRYALWEEAGGAATTDAPFTARARHVIRLRETSDAVQRALDELANDAVELACEELRAATQLLAEMTGEWSTEDLLGSIFGTFCIGK